ncbi:MAG: hypothetical protein LH702_01790 [Phormidesmis sp. CAN_BIN44]|nr:hypothetical protein [Phormidesmis sp. CAN_BIN44]
MVSTQEQNIRLEVKANLLNFDRTATTAQPVAYAFSSGGHLLTYQPIDEQGVASLEIASAKDARAVRVMIGPAIDQKEIQISDLLRRGAEEVRVRIDPDQRRSVVDFTILPEQWRCWLLGLCSVRGTLLKRAERDGSYLDFPVCNATIEIYEVDPLHLIIPRLPDFEIERLRDAIINPPIPDPPPFIPSLAAINPTALRLRPNMGQSIEGAMDSTQSNLVQPHLSIQQTDLQLVARTANTRQLRQTLLENVTLLRPFFCHLFPRWVVKRLIGTATTDNCGHFRSFFFRGCNNPDTPDLYFIAKQRIFPFFPAITIYAPTPVSCHTYWNYACGTEVTLYTTSPLAITCTPCPPVIAPKGWVLFAAIGNHSLSRIYGTSDELAATTTAQNIGLTDGGAPWGGLLRPRLEFDNSLREEMNIMYYRVSWRKGTTGDFQPLIGEVHRHYTHEVGDDLVLEVYPLGPKVVNGVANLFEIPPSLPPLGQWSIPDAVENTTSAKFPTQISAPAADAGKYQLKIELFDAGGQPVVLEDGQSPVNYRVPNVADLSGTIHTEAAADLGLVDGTSMVITLHIDNNVCTAAIAPPTLNGMIANDCGVLQYSPDAPGSVTMPYQASHPNGFATYSFELVRGGIQLTPPTVTGVPVGSSGSFSAMRSVGQLLDSCPIAGFSENLYVEAMATDGWSRLSGYDASAVRAFVLAPPM